MIQRALPFLRLPERQSALRKQYCQIGAVTIFSVLASGLLASTAVHAQQQTPPPGVIVAPVTKQNVDNTQTYTARIEAVSRVELRARVSGFLESQSFIEGERIAKGEQLFGIERSQYEADVTQIRGQIESARADKRLADLEVARQSELVERQTSSQAQLDRAIASQGQAEGALTQLDGALQFAELNLSYTSVVAPFDGRIGLATYDVGEYLTPSSAPLAVVTSIDPIYVLMELPEKDLSMARTDGATRDGVVVRILLPDGTEYKADGKIDFIDVEVERSTDTVTVRAVFPNPDGVLIDGQLVNSRLIRPSDKAEIAIPTSSVMRDQAGSFVLVVGDKDIVEKRAVVVSRQEAGVSVIKSGLNEGETLIVQGQNKARPGAPVNPATAEQAAKEREARKAQAEATQKAAEGGDDAQKGE